MEMTRRWKIFGRGQVKRKIGEAMTREESLHLPQRKRTKTYLSIMNVNNILRLHAKKSLANYHKPRNADGSFVDKDYFGWEQLHMIVDCDSPNVCMDHFFGMWQI